MHHPASIFEASTHIERIPQTTEQCEVMEHFKDAVAALGADNAVFVSFIRDSFDVSPCRFMLACEPSWCNQYIAEGCTADDPWLAYAALHSEPILGSEVPAQTPRQARALSLTTENGFASSLLIPAHSGGGHSRVSVLALGSANPGRYESQDLGHLKVIGRALSMELHEWWLRRIRTRLLVKSRVSVTDLALLQHFYRGRTSKQVAYEMGVSVHSVNSRFQRLNVRLGVRNRKSAVRLAEDCGLLHL